MNRNELGEIFVVALVDKGRERSYLGGEQATFQSYDYVALKRATLFRSFTAADRAKKSMRWTLDKGQELRVIPAH